MGLKCTLCVRMQVTDEILEINSNSTENMLHSEAISIIKSGGNSVKLVIRRAIEDGYQGYQGEHTGL